jgi:ATP-dependent Clp protease adapter protein ClpS
MLDITPSKKRKTKSKPIQLKKVTTVYDILRFMEPVIDILDNHSKKTYLL